MKIKNDLRYVERHLFKALHVACLVDWDDIAPMEGWMITAAQAPPDTVIPELEFCSDAQALRVSAMASLGRVRALLVALEGAAR